MDREKIRRSKRWAIEQSTPQTLEYGNGQRAGYDALFNELYILIFVKHIPGEKSTRAVSRPLQYAHGLLDSRDIS